MSNIEELLTNGLKELKKLEPKSSFGLISSNKLAELPPRMNWQVRNIMQVGELVQIFGSPASGKSLIALDLAFCIASGISFYGNEVKQSDVIYIAGEGFVGLSKRIKGLELKYGVNAPRLMLSKRPASILDSTDIMEVSRAISVIGQDAKMIFIDTLNRNFGGGDENSTADMSQFISNIDQYLKCRQETVVLVHHTGHGNTQRARGNSALYAALDVEYKIEKKGVNISMACTKAKDILEPEPLAFEIKSIALPADETLPERERWIDEYGDIYTAPILQAIEYVTNTKSASTTHKEKMLLKGLREAIETHGTDATSEMREQFGGMREKKVVDLTHWRITSYPLIPVNSDSSDKKKLMAAKLTSFNRTRDRLLNIGKIATFDNQYWIIT